MALTARSASSETNKLGLGGAHSSAMCSPKEAVVADAQEPSEAWAQASFGGVALSQ